MPIRYKYVVLGEKEIVMYETMPKFFLAETPEAAEDIHNNFSTLLNQLAASYAVTTGLDKHDLFGEALIGLARASRDFDPDRGDFRSYALRRMKNALNEFVRDAKVVVEVPRYISDAHKCIEEGDTEKLEALAERHDTTVEVLHKRATYLPSNIQYHDNLEIDFHGESLENAVFIKELLEHMDNDELLVARGVMADQSYRKIDEDNKKPEGWSYRQMEKLRKKIAKLERGGSL